MDEDNGGTPRVTRARSRRLSALPDSDGRAMTPVIDSTVERASPRPVRRTRLNSATADLRTPTRTTRASLARGVTPEPATPTLTLSATKLSSRTPAKSVVRKLPLPEEVIEEEASQTAAAQSMPNPDNNIKGSNDEAKAAAVAAADSKRTPTGTDVNKRLNVSSSSEERRVTRSMSKTPPMKNQTQLQFDTLNSSEEKQKKQTKESIENASEIVDGPGEAHTSLHSDIGVAEESNDSAATKDPMTPALATIKVMVKVKDILMSGKQETPQSTKDPNVSIVKDKDPDATKAEIIEDKAEIEKSVDAPADVPPKPVDPVVVSPANDEAAAGNAEVTNDIRLPDLTPGIKKRLLGTKEAEPVKTVVFTNCGPDEETVKPKFPKTPARTRVAEAGEFFNLTEAKVATPLKSITVKGRNSSTPLAKLEMPSSETLSTASNESNQPPPQIDMIKPLSEPLSDKNPVVERPRLPTPPLDSDDEVVDDETAYIDEKEDEEEDDDDGVDNVFQDPSVAEYFDNEVEVANDYHSGDSMDSSLCEEIAANEIPVDGESVGSKDTTDDQSEDSADEKLSFIVSDDDGDVDMLDIEGDEHGLEDEEDEDMLSPLHFSDEDAGPEPEPQTKKRRRIVINDSSDDADEPENVKENNDDDIAESVEAKWSSDNDSVQENGEKDKNDDIDGTEKEIKIVQEMKENDIEEPKEESVPVDDKGDIGTCQESSEQLQPLQSPKKLESSEQLQPLKSPKKLEKRLHLSVCDSSQLKPQKSDKLNKTAPPIQFNIDQKIHKDAAEVLEDVVVSSNEEKEQKDAKIVNKSFCEVIDSEDEVSEGELPNSGDEISEAESHDEVDLTESPVVKTEETKPNLDKPEEKAEAAASTSKSSTFHANQKREEEAALLSELDSCDLSHLRQMFNPLQKSRRQTLYVQDLQGRSDKQPKPKLKRRSEQLDSDVNPSQSFIETLAEESRQRTKRKRLSKSFCGTVDGSHASESAEMLREANEGTCDKLLQSDIEMGEREPGEYIKEEVAEPIESPKKTVSKVDETVEAEKEEKLPTTATKSRDEYLEYCDTLILAANQAKLEQKKQRVAAGRKQRDRTISKTIPVCGGSSDNATKVGTGAPKQEPVKTTIKKDLKRLQATKQAIKHAMHMLIPETASNHPQSLARKISPQPPDNTKVAKAKAKQRSTNNKQKKNKLIQVSPVKSSDEENHQSPRRIRTTAGYVTVRSNKEPKRIETFKTSSSIVQVEPCTPTSKYFKEIRQSPKPRYGFKEVKIIGRKLASSFSSASSPVRNPATESALRFKREIFGRRHK
ncbi:PREDICTED: protein slender lobes [Drosophila arizonae]|uniref:Protein slender lobes n=1 Tax=Drosophila arizonae TaxID=7263 RepID=A0ABM1PIU3_DROAR|nr:PREDICTED: protein slender lobes [Drosophila arizonae]